MLARILLPVAVAGFALSAVAHIVTFAGVAPQLAMPWIWGLHVGVFVVWLLALLVGGLPRGRGAYGEFRALLRSVSPWLPRAIGALVAYAMMNFLVAVFVLNQGGVPAVLHGRKVLHSHGRIIRELDDDAYRLHEAYTLRAFSGHWLVFYGAAAAFLYARRRRDALSGPGTSGGASP